MTFRALITLESDMLLIWVQVPYFRLRCEACSPCMGMTDVTYKYTVTPIRPPAAPSNATLIAAAENSHQYQVINERGPIIRYWLMPAE